MGSQDGPAAHGGESHAAEDSSAQNDARTYNPGAVSYIPPSAKTSDESLSATYNPGAVSYIPPSAKQDDTPPPSSARITDPVFTSNTIAPSPPASLPASNMLSPLDTNHHQDFRSFVSAATPTPISASGLKIRTDMDIIRGSGTSGRSISRPSSGGSDTSLSASDDRYHGHGHGYGHDTSQPMNIKRTPSIKQVLAEGSLSRSYSGSSPNSLLSSPQLSALPDITPLPSPIVGKGEHGSQSPGMWNGARRGSRRVSRPRSIEFQQEAISGDGRESRSGELHTAIINQKRRQQYQGLSLTSENGGGGARGGSGSRERESNYVKGHGRNRSQSDYHPPPISVSKPRNQTVSGTHEADSSILEEEAGHGGLGGLAPPRPGIGGKTESYMRREPHLAAMRGIGVVAKPPTPPSSRASRKEGEGSDSDSSIGINRSYSRRRERQSRHTYFDAYTFPDNKRRRWRALKPLGEGTFSKVILATSQLDNEDDTIDENAVTNGSVSSHQEPEMDSRKLVAIKICEHGPKGGASEERILLQLKRELELMKDLHHPSLIDLRAFHMEETRMILVLGYCAGGDLFDIASEHVELLKPALVKRIFAEQVMAVKYLHEHNIVHRDVKLENVLVNLPPFELAKDIDWATYPYSITTLTDLGLARKATPGEKLSTRCGSDDYAAPEVIMGQPYDGAEVDAWSLGVVLYTLLELRLPFDPLPGAAGEVNRQRSRTSHRIARVEWRWVKYSGEDGNHDGDYPALEKARLLGPAKAVEGLLRRARSRWTIEKLAELDWVKEMIDVPDGIRFREEEKAVEVEKIEEEDAMEAEAEMVDAPGA